MFWNKRRVGSSLTPPPNPGLQILRASYQFSKPEFYLQKQLNFNFSRKKKKMCAGYLGGTLDHHLPLHSGMDVTSLQMRIFNDKNWPFFFFFFLAILTV